MPDLRSALDPAASQLAAFVPALAGREPRVSLTVRAILDAKALIISFEGEDKRRVFERALEPGAVEELPIRAILGQNIVPVDIYWSAA
jgi:6-phosphogluconolactonase/glucosamine-6-phosphate isomerase/deaminase